MLRNFLKIYIIKVLVNFLIFLNKNIFQKQIKNA